MSLLLLVSASLVVAPVPKPAQFGSWVVACDNGRHCEALGLPSEDGSDDWTFYVARGPGGSAAPTVSFDPAFGDWEGDQRAVRLMIDGRQSEFGLDVDGKLVGEAMIILRAVAAARKVAIVDLTGKELGLLPVEGASAALRWIDDRQKRLGNVSAIVAKGDRPASDVPVPAPLPRIQQPPRSKKPARKLSGGDIKAIQAASEYCDPERAEATTYRLDDQNTLGIVGCLMGAYQGAALIVVIDEKGRWSPASIEQARPPDEHFEPVDAWMLTEGGYVEEDGLLWMAAKGRGLADCGSSATWAWDGRMFRLASYHSLDLCRGAPPGTWFSRWQTANDPLKDE